MGMATAAVGLFHIMAVPHEQYPADSNEELIIWGGASLVGASAVQIACVLGWKVLATASPQHHKWLRKLWATQIFDYHGPKVVAKIGQAARDGGLVVHSTFDAISEGSTHDLVSEALKAAGSLGRKIATVLWLPEGKPEPEGVENDLKVGIRLASDLKDLGR